MGGGGGGGDGEQSFAQCVGRTLRRMTFSRTSKSSHVKASDSYQPKPCPSVQLVLQGVSATDPLPSPLGIQGFAAETSDPSDDSSLLRSQDWASHDL